MAYRIPPDEEESEDEPSVPLAIPCVACGEKVSKKALECRQCGHPTHESVAAYKTMMNILKEARKRVEGERKQVEEDLPPPLGR
jgi:hypothetical protein